MFLIQDRLYIFHRDLDLVTKTSSPVFSFSDWRQPATGRFCSGFPVLLQFCGFSAVT